MFHSQVVRQRTPPSLATAVQEEFLLVDLQSLDVIVEQPAELISQLRRELGEKIRPEFLGAQIRTATAFHDDMASLREETAELRHHLARIAGRFDLAPMAAGTHPFADWHRQRQTRDGRQHAMALELRDLSRRLLTCGMQVKVMVEEPDLRIDLMNQVSYFVPHILALSTSSPFWLSANTGLKSYRISAFSELPRTGLPDLFDSWADFEAHTAVLIQAGLIEDISSLWWDLRPSSRDDALEMRVADACTRIEDSIAIAALYRCLLRYLYRLRQKNQRWRSYARMLINENRWRAQCYGTDAGLVDLGTGEIRPYKQLLPEMLAMLAEDAEALGCEMELDTCAKILNRGTSAHLQIGAFTAATRSGRSEQDAWLEVVRLLLDMTLSG
ncbi:carboxylate-amine ligase [Marinospirillum alkaliphilum]|uniref:Putative glutamate--cysteine ligase 2 n=1 Tax=Marinospirillum alkaliphilum DSM 21637 TaxID=1122209 RepID=A0A1K1XPC3_9GAMM|nr:carboxylate-amine ligase [Marinospirillum alkaliphilum]SFX51382.1 carboxylate-amine ligase [Marinospirillum alkaliphilum DSM 21637]